MTAFYDPARRALTPNLVPRHRLHLATTLDSFAWSLTGAIGSSLGGLAASKFGVQACFYIDAGTYLFSAACAFRLKVEQLVISALAANLYLFQRLQADHELEYMDSYHQLSFPKDRLSSLSITLDYQMH